MNAKMLWRVTKGAYEEFNEDKVLRLSGALAYYALFSLAPLVIIVISIAGIVFLLLVSMLLSAALSALSGVMGDTFGVSPAIAHALHLLVSFLVITLLFAMIFKVLPDATVKWNDVWSGALFTSALFTLGKFLLGFYLGRAATASTYGAAGSVVIV